jgi:hypothetical protein
MDASASGWKIYATDEVEITLPGTFIGGNPKKWKRELQNAVATAPEKWQPNLRNFFSNTDVPFLAADTAFREDQEFPTTCLINFDKLAMANMPLQQYMNALLYSGSSLEVIETGYVNFPRFQAIKLISVTRKPPPAKGIGDAFKLGYQAGSGKVNKTWEISGKHLMYTLITGKRAWHVMFGCPVNRFESLMPLFEQCAQTFVVKVY